MACESCKLLATGSNLAFSRPYRVAHWYSKTCMNHSPPGSWMFHLNETSATGSVVDYITSDRSLQNSVWSMFSLDPYICFLWWLTSKINRAYPIGYGNEQTASWGSNADENDPEVAKKDDWNETFNLIDLPNAVIVHLLSVIEPNNFVLCRLRCDALGAKCQLRWQCHTVWCISFLSKSGFMQNDYFRPGCCCTWWELHDAFHCSISRIWVPQKIQLHMNRLCWSCRLSFFKSHT